MKIIMFLTAVIFLGTSPVWALFGGTIREGNTLYEEGEYGKAAEKYKEALKSSGNSDMINFNLGTALYKSGEYDAAVEPLQKSLLSDDGDLRARANYNLGNALYKSGIRREKTDLNKAIQSLEQSLKSYERTLAADGEDADAKYNYDFVKKELERLKKKQEQQEQQQKQQKDNQDQNKDRQDQQNQQNQQDQQQNQQSRQDDEDSGQQQQDQQQQDKEERQENSGQQGEQQEKTAQQMQAGEVQEMTEKEAEQLLRQFQEGEPAGRLNLQPADPRERPVLKDW